jgi:hypothetical protein
MRRLLARSLGRALADRGRKIQLPDSDNLDWRLASSRLEGGRKRALTLALSLYKPGTSVTGVRRQR